MAAGYSFASSGRACSNPVPQFFERLSAGVALAKSVLLFRRAEHWVFLHKGTQSLIRFFVSRLHKEHLLDLPTPIFRRVLAQIFRGSPQRPVCASYRLGRIRTPNVAERLSGQRYVLPDAKSRVLDCWKFLHTARGFCESLRTFMQKHPTLHRAVG